MSAGVLGSGRVRRAAAGRGPGFSVRGQAGDGRGVAVLRPVRPIRGPAGAGRSEAQVVTDVLVEFWVKRGS